MLFGLQAASSGWLFTTEPDRRCTGLERSGSPVPWLHPDPYIVFYSVFCLLLSFVLSIGRIKVSAFSTLATAGRIS